MEEFYWLSHVLFIKSLRSAQYLGRLCADPQPPPPTTEPIHPPTLDLHRHTHKMAKSKNSSQHNHFLFAFFSFSTFASIGQKYLRRWRNLRGAGHGRRHIWKVLFMLQDAGMAGAVRSQQIPRGGYCLFHYGAGADGAVLSREVNFFPDVHTYISCTIA